MIDQKAKAKVAFDCAIRGMDRKLETPTAGLVQRILEEAGLGGEWTLKDARRIRKKGRARFSVIRMESRAGAKSVRIWCKPKGNDTCFEYSLYSPPEVNIEEAFSLLENVNPVSLSIPESALLPGAFFGRVLDLPQPIVPSKKPPKLFLVEEPRQEVSHSSSEEVEKGKEALEPSVEKGVANAEPEKATAKSAPDSVGESPLSLSIEDESDLWDKDVADKALVAISLVAEGGFAKKAEASASIIKRLEIERFASGSNECYRTVQGAMRALTMALWKKWRYIDRVRYATEDGRGASDTIRGYQITAKGQKRLESLATGKEREASKAPSEVASEIPTQFRRTEISPTIASEAVSPMNMNAIKDMVSRHESANKQIEEVTEVIGSLDADLRSMGIEMEGLEAVEAERRRRLAEIGEELKEIAAKKKELSEKIDKRQEERLQWEEMMEPHLAERNKIESILMKRGGNP